MAGILAVAALFACTPEENNPTGSDELGGGKDGTVHVTGISLDHPSATIKEGETITLVATVTPDNAANKTVKWSSSSETVATVDGNGKVTGIKVGSATITATTEDGGKKATCALTVEANLAPSVTVGAEHVSAISVVLRGKANLGTSAASDLKVGFQYSKSAGILPSNSTTVDAEDSDADFNYTTGLTRLEPATTYYFRSFVRQNGQDTYGETKEFTTKGLDSLIDTNDASDVEATKATLNAKLDLTDVKYSSISYGFYRGTSETTQNTKLNGGEIKGNTYSASLTNLSHKTQYWYKAFVTLDGNTYYGDVKTFTTDVVQVESVSLDKTKYTFNSIGSTLTLKATVLPADATDKTVEWSSDNEDVATVDANGNVTSVSEGIATIKADAKDGSGKFATCSVSVVPFVDLGLPSGLKWANANLGASSPEDYGDYYAWGEVEPYYSSQDPLTWKEGKSEGYEWPSYKWCNGSYNKQTKYCPTDKTSYWDGEGSPDGKTVLDQEDDAAHVSLGGKWRMPTDAEWTELREKCTWTWTTQNGVNGRLVTGPNGNSIFLPAAGDRDNTNFNNAGSYGNYWSSSLNTDYPSCARYVYFSSNQVSRNYLGRRLGFSIRPVTE